MKANAMLKKLLFITVLCFTLNACNGNDKQNEYDDYDYDGIEVIVVNHIPRGVFADEELPEIFRDRGWYDIGLSRNGEEPVEYIWRARKELHDHAIMNAGIGDRGTIHLTSRAKQNKMKLPRPNAEKPPIIGILGYEYWKKTEMDVQNTQWNLMLDGKKYIILRPYILRDIETGEIIDLRTTDRIKPGSGGEFMREIN